MKAAVLLSQGKIEIVDKLVPSIRPDEVLVKVTACGICASDVKKFTGDSSCKMPIVLGHEIGGYVSKAGNETSFSQNERVSIMPDISCGTCEYCSRNRFNLCSNLKSVGYGTDLIEAIDGGFAEFVKVPAATVLRLGEGISYQDATYIEPMSAALRTVDRVNLKVDDNVAIIGDGRMGLLHLQLFRIWGVKNAFVIGLIDERLKLAESLGATRTINGGREDPNEVIMKETRVGVDAVIDTTGSIAAINSSVSLLRKGGELVLFASARHSDKLTIEANRVHYDEVTITGSYGVGSRMDFVKAADLIGSGRVNVRSLTSSVLPLEQLERGFKDVAERKSVRTIVRLDDAS